MSLSRAVAVAAFVGDVPAVDAALAGGLVADAADPAGCTALMHAARGDRAEVVTMLLNAGASAHVASTYDRMTALHFAADTDSLDAARALTAADATCVDLPGCADDSTPLILAARKGHAAVVRHLALEAGASVHRTRTNGATPLYMAAQAGSAAAVEALLAAGSVVDQPRTDAFAAGTTPLCIAAEKGAAEVVALLLAAGANPSHVPADGATALLTASHRGHLAVVQALVAAGADMEARLLEPADEYPQARDSTALWLAAYFGRYDVAAALLAAGASPLARSVSGMTPAQVVCGAGLQADASREAALRQLLADAEAAAGGAAAAAAPGTGAGAGAGEEGEGEGEGATEPLPAPLG
jgi:uncharacterized protein